MPDEPAPVEYIRAELCRTFHCLPSQLDNEPELLQMMSLLNLANTTRMEEANRGKR